MCILKDLPTTIKHFIFTHVGQFNCFLTYLALLYKSASCPGKKHQSFWWLSSIGLHHPWLHNYKQTKI